MTGTYHGDSDHCDNRELPTVIAWVLAIAVFLAGFALATCVAGK